MDASRKAGPRGRRALARLALAAAVLSPGAGPAAAEPGFAETVEYIQTRFAQCGEWEFAAGPDARGRPARERTAYGIARGEGFAVELKRHVSDDIAGWGGALRREISVDLGDLFAEARVASGHEKVEALGVVKKGWLVRLKCAKFGCFRMSDNFGDRREASAWAIRVCDRKTARKLANAFRHAIRLAGGKPPDGDGEDDPF